MDRSRLTSRILFALILGGCTLPETARASESGLQRCYQPDNGYRQDAAYASMRRYQPDRAYSADARFSANARFDAVARFEARKALVVHAIEGKSPANPRPSGWFASQAKDHRPRPAVLDNLRTWNQLEDIGLRSVLRAVTSSTTSQSETGAAAESASALAEARESAAAALLEWESKQAVAQDGALTSRERAIALRAEKRAQILAHRAVVAITTLENRADRGDESALDWRSVEEWLSSRATPIA